MIEICGKLDKSNTYLRFRCVTFCSSLKKFVKTKLSPNEMSQHLNLKMSIVIYLLVFKFKFKFKFN